MEPKYIAYNNKLTISRTYTGKTKVIESKSQRLRWVSNCLLLTGIITRTNMMLKTKDSDNGESISVLSITVHVAKTALSHEINTKNCFILPDPLSKISWTSPLFYSFVFS